MLAAPIGPVVQQDLVDALPKMIIAQRQRHPADTVDALDLNAIAEAALGILHIVIMDEDVRQANLLEQADPGEVHRL
ncbi:hypothetical protein LP421_16495 [Rhizobium sp. RCAM05350]|nr:hypothetical protein LP421_16495 [Rhizobium sp. RCAM05350]